MVRASDSEARVRVSLLTRFTMLCPLARQIYSPKVLVIPGKGWPGPNMTVKLFTGTLRIKCTKQINKIHSTCLARCTNGCKPFGQTFCITGFWMALGIVNSMELSIQVLHI